MKKIRIKPTGAAFIAVLVLLAKSRLPFYAVPIAVHEFGHIAAALLSGHGISAITLDGSGFTIDLDGAADYKTELIISAAGPLASIALAALLMPYFSFCARISLALGAVNLLPVSGLDGSGILSSLVLQRCRLSACERLFCIFNTVFLSVLIPLSVAALVMTRCHVSVLIFTAALFFDLCFKRRY